jgi:hypothetical protein
VVSPISVLDASFYNDELTPVKRISDSFRGKDLILFKILNLNLSLTRDQQFLLDKRQVLKVLQ